MSDAVGIAYVGRARRAWLYVLVTLVLLFLILPVLIIIPMSFSSSRFLDFPPSGWSLRWYTQYFTRPEWVQATWVSVRVALISCALATPLGVLAAYGIHARRSKEMRRIHVLLLLPLMVPHIIIAIGIFFVLGYLNMVTSLIGLIMANTMLTLPFVVTTTLAGLRNFDMTQELAARILGHNRFWSFTLVTLPQIMGSVISGALFAFIMSLDEVVVALFISGGPNTTLTKIMFTALRDEIDPSIAAISSMLVGMTVLIGTLAAALNRRK